MRFKNIIYQEQEKLGEQRGQNKEKRRKGVEDRNYAIEHGKEEERRSLLQTSRINISLEGH